METREPAKTREKGWWIVQQGAKVGPLSDEKFAELVRCEKITANDYGWHAGLKEWTRLGDVPSLQSLFAEIRRAEEPLHVQVAEERAKEQSEEVREPAGEFSDGNPQEQLTRTLLLRDIPKTIMPHAPRNRAEVKPLGSLGTTDHSGALKLTALVMGIVGVPLFLGLGLSLKAPKKSAQAKPVSVVSKVQLVAPLPAEAEAVLLRISDAMEESANQRNGKYPVHMSPVDPKHLAIAENRPRWLESPGYIFRLVSTEKDWAATAISRQRNNGKLNILRISSKREICFVFSSEAGKPDEGCPQRADGNTPVMPALVR